ncbi:tRNA uridine-5-carboxymethylaminomethyl(34) synthesis GTPase MnmE [Deferribacter autotrophicus]|uniref:tRNA modification GTPase MnmE n=1 Tax=Deferribacter autotrophicus TaxID=500465 RepID=A0A5A8F792_9BACT|nr:tRNA uridine-5-carboxymethylaminomethyl(34) synthesis GTPase MnmE [Deferribacter autotrophicus]KAA0258848.1 tRNA uridine-5-carboxymethylaminomethyl(34) synthesis GTPase MnmE [Deferribacter autotrophicus]
MDTIVAPITPLFRSSVITIRISGSKAFDIKKYLYVNGKPLQDLKYRYVYHGEFISENVEDDCVFYFFKGPNSYTGEDVVEISFHGNPLIVQNALQDIFKLGIRLAEPGEFTKRAFLNGKIDLVQAEAVYELIESRSITGIHASFKKLKEGLQSQLSIIKDNLIDLLSVVEAYVDFPEEDLGDYELQYVYNKLDDVIKNLQFLIKSFEMNRYNSEGVKIAIVGKPNVGKSSLMNYLLRENRVIVSEIPGTTRDIIEEEIFIKGYPIKLIDTAGIRESADQLEKIGIEFSKKKLGEADIILALFDLSDELDDMDEEIMKLVKNKEVVIIGNKVDKKKIEFDCDVEISVKTGEGVEQLFEIIEKRIKNLVSLGGENGMILNERQKFVFEEILDVIIGVKENFEKRTLDILAVDLHYCLNKISEITGEIYTEDILKNIFTKFCIGK